MANRWSLEEENLLVEVWLEVSQENYEKRSFWNEVVESFNNQSGGDHRNKNMVTSKWGRLSTECKNFNYIYKHVHRNIPDDNNRLQTTKRIFEERFGGRSFEYAHMWFILRNHPKWNE